MAQMNYKFRLWIYSRWPTALDASKGIGIDSRGNSLLVRNRGKPTIAQRAKLRGYLSDYQLRRMFPREVSEARIEGVETVGNQ
jgi:hypothetical protein